MTAYRFFSIKNVSTKMLFSVQQLVTTLPMMTLWSVMWWSRKIFVFIKCEW